MRIERRSKANSIFLISEKTDGEKSLYIYLKNILPKNSGNKPQITVDKIIGIAYLKYSNDCHSRTMIGMDASYIDFLLKIFLCIRPEQEGSAMVKQLKQALDKYCKVLKDLGNIEKLKKSSERLPSPDAKANWESYFLACNKYLQAQLSILYSARVRSNLPPLTHSEITFFDDSLAKSRGSIEATESTRLLPKSSLQFSEDEQEENSGCFSTLRRLCCG